MQRPTSPLSPWAPLLLPQFKPPNQVQYCQASQPWLSCCYPSTNLLALKTPSRPRIVVKIPGTNFNQTLHELLHLQSCTSICPRTCMCTHKAPISATILLKNMHIAHVPATYPEMETARRYISTPIIHPPEGKLPSKSETLPFHVKLQQWKPEGIQK